MTALAILIVAGPLAGPAAALRAPGPGWPGLAQAAGAAVALGCSHRAAGR